MAPTVVLLGLSLFLFGGMIGGLDVAMNTWAAEVEQHRGRPVMSSLHAMYPLGAGLGAATGYLAASVDLGVSAHFAVAVVLFAAICLWMANVDWQFDRPRTARRGPIYALPKRGLAIVAVVAFCASIGEGGMDDWSAIFLVAVADVGDADAALGITVFSVTMMITRLVGDRFVARVGPTVAGRFSGVVATLGVVIAVAFGSFGAALVGFALMGVGYALIMPLAFTRAASDGARRCNRQRRDPRIWRLHVGPACDWVRRRSDFDPACVRAAGGVRSFDCDIRKRAQLAETAGEFGERRLNAFRFCEAHSIHVATAD